MEFVQISHIKNQDIILKYRLLARVIDSGRFELKAIRGNTYFLKKDFITSSQLKAFAIDKMKCA